MAKIKKPPVLCHQEGPCFARKNYRVCRCMALEVEIPKGETCPFQKKDIDETPPPKYKKLTGNKEKEKDGGYIIHTSSGVMKLGNNSVLHTDPLDVRVSSEYFEAVDLDLKYTYGHQRCLNHQRGGSSAIGNHHAKGRDNSGFMTQKGPGIYMHGKTS